MIKPACIAIVGCFLISGVAHAADVAVGVGADMAGGHDARDDKGRPPPRGERPPLPAGIGDVGGPPGGYADGPGAHQPGDGPPPPPPVNGHGPPLGEPVVVRGDIHGDGGH